MKKTVITSSYSVGSFVWVKAITNGVYDTPRACRILSVANKQLKVIDDDKKEFWISTGSVLKELHPSSLLSLEDMTNLGELQEYTILRNIHIRFNNNTIYTYVGKMLISINPYKQLPIYNDVYIKKYRHMRNVEDLPAHIYAISNDCFRTMKEHATGQCIVISGESGAGKTESTKLIVKYLASVSGKLQEHKIEEQIIQANPLLEAFGNAQTTYNDNSSRFGKFIVMSYNEWGALQGAHIQQYLLEKSRVTQLKPKERNYHIFYQLLNGLTLDEKRELDLHTSKQFTYLNHNLSFPYHVFTEDLEKIRNAMKILDFSTNEIQDIFKLLAAILHLGNISYRSTVIENMENTEIRDEASLDSVCKLLCVEREVLKETLSKKTLLILGKKTVSPVNKVQAVMTKNGFAKALYDRLFSFVVERINKTLNNNNNNNKASTKYTIGLLDIYGFEDMGINSFEQLCINYTNEHLQQFFVRHIFKMEQEEYAKEAIKWAAVEFEDNESVLHLIGCNRPNSLLKIIDEQSNLMTGSDEAVLLKANKVHWKNYSYINPKSDFDHSFGILHFAGVVFYNIEGFLEKNQNPLSNNWLQLINSSKHTFTKELFAEDIASQLRSIPRQPVKLRTVAGQYQRSLDFLMKSLNSSEPYFIRCIKPNSLKKPNLFDHGLCCSQLRYSGIMGTTEIRSSGYPIHYKYSDFVDRFRHIVGSQPANKVKDCKKVTQEICSKVLATRGGDYQFGKTKVFLKSNHDVLLDSAKNKVLWDRIVLIQKNWKRYCERKRYVRMKRAAVIVQKSWRMYRERRSFLLLRKGILRLQASIRSRELTRSLQKRLEQIVKLQALCRGYLKRKEIRETRAKNVKNQDSVESVGNIDDWITSIFDAAVEDDEKLNFYESQHL